MSGSQPPGEPSRPIAGIRLGERSRPARAVVSGPARALSLAVVLVLLLELFHSGHLGQLASLALNRPGVLVANIAVMVVLVGLVWAVLGGWWPTATVMLPLMPLTGLLSNVKMRARQEPLFPSDLVYAREPGFLLSMASPRVVLVVVLMPLVVTLTVVLARRALMVPRLRPRGRAVWAARAVVAVCSVCLLASAARFHNESGLVRQGFDRLGAVWTGANQPRNYSLNGFVGGFLYNVDATAMQEPAGYSRSAMLAIARRYEQVASKINRERSGVAMQDVNVVMVLAEAFSDPTRLKEVQLDRDPIPQTRALARLVPSGNLLTQKVGAGTANMEFEALTGMSLAQLSPLVDTPYQMIVPQNPNFPSAVGLFKRLGHRTVALHPYRKTMYQRHRVYPTLGFDVFRHEQTFQHRGSVGRSDLVSDRSSFDEAIGVLEDSQEPAFINLVTMQNHYAYDDRYDDPFEVTGMSPAENAAVGQYSRGLAHTDRAITKFVQELSDLNEKTVVVIYGDHLPAGYPPEVLAANGWRTAHETPYLIYSNFSDQRHEETTTMSAIYFMPEVFEIIGAEIPPYYALLSELQREIPAMQHGLMVGADGREADVDDLSIGARRLLADYRMVQYDLSVGARFAQEELFYPATATATATVARATADRSELTR